MTLDPLPKDLDALVLLFEGLRSSTERLDQLAAGFDGKPWEPCPLGGIWRTDGAWILRVTAESVRVTGPGYRYELYPENPSNV